MSDNNNLISRLRSDTRLVSFVPGTNVSLMFWEIEFIQKVLYLNHRQTLWLLLKERFKMFFVLNHKEVYNSMTASSRNNVG